MGGKRRPNVSFRIDGAGPRYFGKFCRWVGTGEYAEVQIGNIKRLIPKRHLTFECQ